MSGAARNIPYAEVIGDPIAHSKSPIIHRFWLEALGIEADYRACHVRPAELGDYFAERRDDPDWRGCNVTIPHKQAVLDHIPDPLGLADTLGAANTVYKDSASGLALANTDVGGFAVPLADRALAARHVVLIGAGGAARAILAAFNDARVGRVTLMARNAAKAGPLLDDFGMKGQVVPLDASLPSDAVLLVNSSPLGMTGQPMLELDLAPLPPDALVYDIVYAPLETRLLAAARARGLATIDGLEMLIGQAALAFEKFFGQPPPRDRDGELRARLVAQ